MIVKVVLSTAPMERVSIFDTLLACNGSLTTNQITEFLDVSKPTALRTMTELKALGLVDMKEQQIQCEDSIKRNVMVISLKREQFGWFLSEEFKTLRQGFKPEESEAEAEQDDEDNIASDARKEKSPHLLQIIMMMMIAAKRKPLQMMIKINRRYMGEKFFTRLL
jgi:DNA-binding transcriptional ArsR family regulator